MNLSLDTIIEVTAAKASAKAKTDNAITSLLIDSRSLDRPEGVMFCAIRTSAADGHRYIADMYGRGVRAFLVENMPADIDAMPDATFLQVASVENAITAIAKYWRQQLQGVTIFAITGSVGKTVVKEMLYQAMLPYEIVTRSPRSWNSRLGVPLSICEIPNIPSSYAIIEVGIDRADTMADLADVVQDNIGIFMPVTDEHDAGFASREAKIREKAKLFAESELIVYDATDPLVGKILKEQCHHALLMPIRGLKGDEFNRKVVTKVLKEMAIPVKNVENAFAPNDRIELNDGINGCAVIYDGFTNDYRSLVSSLDFAHRRFTENRSNTLILTDLLHRPMSPAEIKQLYDDVTTLAHRFGIDRIVPIGAEASANIKADLAATSPAKFLANFHDGDFNKETILMVGKPSRELVEIRARLEAPRHDTVMDVALNAIVHNFNHYRGLLKASTGLVAMVKASAYGIGAVEIAKTLQSQGAAYLAVAVIDEGVELRQGGITMPIVVLNPITGNYKALFDYNLEPSIFSRRELDTLLDEARYYGVCNFRAHIKLDTGMHRVGFIEDDLPALVKKLANEPAIRIASVFSHLATADCLDMDSYTQFQLDTFDRMSQFIKDGLPYPVKRHILNTAGIMRYPEYQYDMVRLGIGLYGISPLPQPEPDLHTVASLRSTVISIKNWPAGTTIGYGRRGVLNRDSVIATVPIGYADGIDRHLGNRAANFVVRGVECPTIGNICMDQCMIDVTDVPDVAIGDSVEIFGTQMPVTKLAETLTTIPYELLTSVSPRVKRIYFRN